MPHPDELSPVWIQFPRIPWGSIGWRMGPGEDYWHEWVKWWKTEAPANAKHGYQGRWPEPAGWEGFYEWASSGTTPPWVLEERRKTEAAAQPPKPEEDRITERYRVKWLATQYFRKPKVSVRDPRERKLCKIMADPEGWLWKLTLPGPEDKEPASPYFTRQVTKVIGDDNLPVKQPVA